MGGNTTNIGGNIPEKDSIVGPGDSPVRAGSIGRDTSGQAEPPEHLPNLSSFYPSCRLLTGWLRAFLKNMLKKLVGMIELEKF